MNRLIRPLVFTSFLTLPSAFAEDIQIYTGTVGTGSGSVVNPNILFIADSSGSMDDYVPSSVAAGVKGDYDPNFDYGDDGAAADDAYIYIYDDLEAYTGVYITDSQNACDAMSDALAAAPTYPLWTGQAMQWIPTTVQVIDEEAVVCANESTPAQVDESYSGVVGTRDDGWQVLDTFDHTQMADGSDMTLTVTTVDGYSNFGLDARVQVAETDSDGNLTSSFTSLCTLDTGSYNSNKTRSCTASTDDFSYTYFKVRLTIRSESEDTDDGKDTYAAEDISHSSTFSYNINAPTVYTDEEGNACTPSEATYMDVGDGEWSTAFEINADADAILECANDQGTHGQTDASTDVYAAICGSDLCASPNYNNTAGIDWTTSGADNKYFYTGAYHDYLNYVPAPPGTVWDVNDTYYDWSDSNNRWQLEGSYTLESWCEEDETDLYLVDPAIASMSGDDISDGTAVGNFLTATFTDSIGDPGNYYTCVEKAATMRAALSDLTNSLTGVNLGLMYFNTAVSGNPDDGGSVVFAMRDVDGKMEDGTTDVRDAMLTAISNIPDTGGTPLSETMWEAYRYYRGLSEDNAHSSVTDSAAYSTGSTYDSPIDHSCQVNTIVYITDGLPSGDDDENTSISGLVPGSCSGDGGCLDDLAGYMFDNDLSSHDGTNNVITYTIGFAINFALLANTAAQGGGEYFTADNYADLQSAFQQILIDISLSQPSVLVAPAVSVNAFNELQHRDQIYYATFKPSSTPRWEGNVKKYTISGDGTVMDNSNPPINAIDSSTGFFSTFAQSYWSDQADGPNVELGGYREQLTNSRTIYVDGDSVSGGTAGDITQLTSSSTLLTSATGAADSTEAGELRDWLLGIDVDDDNTNGVFTDASQYGGDSLHSKPFVITYKGTSEADAEDVLIATTNQGVLHAVDARDNMGGELWAYVPHETIDNIKTYRDNPTSTGHAYGLDGEATVWTIEASNSTPTNFNIETAYMYQGMRRGGDTYFAWDISNGDMEDNTKDPISTLWKIDSSTSGFSDLGQSWSKMIRTRIRYGCDSADVNTGCTTKDVLVFSGGYDTFYDTESNSANAGSEVNAVDGDAVYIVDAVTGALLWSVGNNSTSSDTHALSLPMYNSIPGDPNPIDINGDGDMDMLYFIDISGMIYRVDFDQSKALDGTGTDAYAIGGNIADLTENGKFRRFYNGLDISLITPIEDSSFLAISVGSGYRAQPKEEESFANRFYVLIDENVTEPEVYGPNDDDIDEETITYQYVKTYGDDDEGNQIVTERDVIKQSDLHVYASDDPYERGTDGDYGFYRNLSTTLFEKILQTSVTFGGEILVSSYSPISDTSEATCGAGEIGSGRVYKFSVETGESTFDIDGDGYVTDSDGDYLSLAHEGIPPDTTILLVPELVTCIGTECSDDWLTLETGQAERTFWRENQ